MTEQSKHSILLLIVLIIMIFGIVLILVSVFDKIKYYDELEHHEEPDEVEVERTSKALTIGILILIGGFVLGCIFKL